MSKNTSKTKLSKLLKEGNSLLKKNKLSQALTKFKEAQKKDPNNSKINRAVSTITTKINQSFNPERIDHIEIIDGPSDLLGWRKELAAERRVQADMDARATRAMEEAKALMSATPERIQELEQREIELNNELEKEKESLRICRLNVQNKIKER